MLTAHDLDALVTAGGTDPDALGVAADAAEEAGDGRATALREEAAWWRLPEESRWEWVRRKFHGKAVREKTVLRVKVNGGTATASAYPSPSQDGIFIDLWTGPLAGSWVRFGPRGWEGARGARCSPPSCAPAVLAALRAALTKEPPC
jgi:hypothetical protein